MVISCEKYVVASPSGNRSILEIKSKMVEIMFNHSTASNSREHLCSYLDFRTCWPMVAMEDKFHFLQETLASRSRRFNETIHFQRQQTYTKAYVPVRRQCVA